MSVQMSSPWRPGTGPSSAGPNSHAGSDLRLSDAERSATADNLAAHYAEGRLDRAEFDERLDRAMAAKTRGDLAGIFAGLPPAGTSYGAAYGATSVGSPAVPVAARQRHLMPAARPAHRVLMILILIAITATLGQALGQFHAPWLLIGLLIFLWVRHRHHRR